MTLVMKAAGERASAAVSQRCIQAACECDDLIALLITSQCRYEHTHTHTINCVEAQWAVTEQYNSVRQFQLKFRQLEWLKCVGEWMWLVESKSRFCSWKEEQIREQWTLPRNNVKNDLCFPRRGGTFSPFFPMSFGIAASGRNSKVNLGKGKSVKLRSIFFYWSPNTVRTHQRRINDIISFLNAEFPRSSRLYFQGDFEVSE